MVREKYFNCGNRFNSVNIGVAIPITYGATKARIKSCITKSKQPKPMPNSNKKHWQRKCRMPCNNTNRICINSIIFSRKHLPNAKEIVAAAQLGYKTGDISYVEYLFALQTTTDIQLNYLKSIQQVNQSVINIYSLINK